MYLNPDAVSKLAKLAKCLWYHLSPCTCSCSLAQLCLILCDPTDSSPPGSSVYGMSQAKTQEKVAISSSRRSSWPRDWTHISWVFCLGRRILCHWATGNILLDTQLSQNIIFHWLVQIGARQGACSISSCDDLVRLLMLLK